MNLPPGLGSEDVDDVPERLTHLDSVLDERPRLRWVQATGSQTTVEQTSMINIEQASEAILQLEGDLQKIRQVNVSVSWQLLLQ